MTQHVQPCPKCGTAITVPLKAPASACPACGHAFAGKMATEEATKEFHEPAPDETVDDPSSRATRTASALPEKLGRFVIRRRLGAGAFGVVYEAHDPQLDRSVAVKVARLDRGDADQRVKRFLREAKAAANLRHPHIVPVYEYGQDGARFFIASAYIEGRTLEMALKEWRGARGVGRDSQQASSLATGHSSLVTRIIRHMAEALAYAHGQGIIHRDVKPANTMLDEKDEPLIMDFGLAAREEDEKLTREGTAMGTAAYVAPEQATGNAVAASDQYSLGCTFYEMLTGKTPFAGKWDEQIYHHLHTEPRSPRQLEPGLPRDLETICLKCLEKDPSKRYADCQALADDLRRWADHEPIQARRIGPLERFDRWCRRNPVAAGMAALVLFTLILGTTVASWFAVQSARNADKAQSESREKDRALADMKTQLARSEGLLYISQFNEAWNLLEKKDVIGCRRSLDATRWDLRGLEYGYLVKKIAKAEPFRSLTGHPRGITSLAVSNDGARVFSGGGFEDNSIKAWNLRTGACEFTLLGHKSYVGGLALTRDGKRLVSGGGYQDNTIKVWDLESRKEVFTLGGQSGTILSLALSHDGKTLYSGSGGMAIKVWDLDAGTESAELRGHGGPVSSLVLSSDGTRLYSGSHDHTIRVWDVQAGKEIRTLKGHAGDVLSLALSGDGKRLISGGGFKDRTIKVWALDSEPDSAAGPILTLRGHEDRVVSLALSADGKRLISAGLDQALKVWDLDAGKEILPLQGPQENHDLFSACCLILGHDGKRLFSAGSDGAVKIWDVDPGPETRTLRGHVDPVLCLAVTADGKRLFSAGEDRSIKTWDLDTGKEARTLAGHVDQVNSLVLTPAETQLFSASNDGAVKQWDVKSGKDLLTLRLLTPVLSLALHGDKNLLTGTFEKDIKGWDVTTGKMAFTLPGHSGHVTCLALGTDGSQLASAGQDGTIKVWDMARRVELKTFRAHEGQVHGLAIIGDGKRLFSAGEDATIRLWIMPWDEQPVVWRGHTAPVRALVPSPDGKRLFSASDDRTVRTWDLATGTTTAVRNGTAGVKSLTVSPDGKWLFAGNADGTIQLFDESER